MPRPPELLCPAGDWAALRAAVANGADAVYFGLDAFNARIRAANFRLDELTEVMTFLHRRNVRGFVTFNTLVFSDELDAAAEYVRACAVAKVDALIVQDLGAVRLIRAVAPGLEIHGSTQMTLTEPRGVAFVGRMGASRVVLGRELSVDDVRKVGAADTGVELEVFVHGALCVAYSGQCLTSESLGGRSANRGVCAQACRLPYELFVDGQRHDLDAKRFLVSPHDLAAPDLVADLADAGVACLKIEGRLKGPAYVAATAAVYRRAVDALESDYALQPRERADLEQSFSRGLGHGFLGGTDHQALVGGTFSKKRGRRIGAVVGRTPRGVLTELVGDGELAAGDGVLFDDGGDEASEKGGHVYAVRPRGTRLEIELGNRDARPDEIALGSVVWKTLDPAMEKRLAATWARDRVARPLPVDARVTAKVGEPLRVEFTDGTHIGAAASAVPLEAARNRAADVEQLRANLARLGDTPFALRDLVTEIEGGPMVPASLLNELRREAAEALFRARHPRIELTHDVAGALAKLRENARAGAEVESSAACELHVLARTLEQVEALCEMFHVEHSPNPRPGFVYCDFEDVRRYPAAVEACRAAGVPIALATMRVIKPGEEGWLRQVLNAKPDAALVRNLAGVGFFSEHAPGLPLIGDFALNVANELTAGVFFDAGLTRLVPSYDLSWAQMAAMLARSDPARFECVLHQHMPMFHMEHCVFANALSEGKDYRDCGRPCERHAVDLSDRYGKRHPLVPDAGCRNTLFNGDAQSAAEYAPRMRVLGVRHFRVELLRQKPHEVAPLVQGYLDVLAGRVPPRAAVRSLRVVSQLGVTAGTLERA